MAVAFRQAATFVTAATSTPGGPSLASAPLSGSLLIAFDYSTTAPSATPAGWTQLRQTFDGTAYLTVFYKISNGSDGSLSIAHNNPYLATMILAEYTGVHATSPIDTHDGATVTGTATTVVAPTVTAAQAGMLLGCFGQGDGGGAGGSFTPPAGMTERADSGDAANSLWLELADLVVAAGATGSKTATFNRTPTTTNDSAAAVVLRSANTPPTAPTPGSPADAAVTTLNSGATFTWTHNDADANPQDAFAFKRVKGAVTEWWTGAAWASSETWVSSSTQSVTFPAGQWATGTYTWTVATRDAEDASPYATARTVTSNAVPNASALGYPSSGQTIDRGVTQRFSWTFSDPDSGDSQSAEDFRYRLVGAPSWTTLAKRTTTSQFRDFTASTFAAGDYEWQVRTYDALGVAGPYSSSGFFTAADAPAGPTITAPINGGTIDTNPYTVTWSVADQDAYQVRTVADDGTGSPDTATVYTDTGTVESAIARSATAAFATNGRDEHVQLRVRYDSLWSSWASNLASVDYTVPSVPTVALTADDETAAILVEISNPAPSGSEPTVTEHRVWRREGDSGDGIRIAVGLLPGLDFTDRTPASGVDYQYRVESVGANQTVSTSEWTTTATSGSISGDLLDGGAPDTTFTSEADGGTP